MLIGAGVGHAVQIVKEADTQFRFDEQPFLAFERLTMCPLQRKMIDLQVRRPLAHAVVSTSRGPAGCGLRVWTWQ